MILPPRLSHRLSENIRKTYRTPSALLLQLNKAEESLTLIDTLPYPEAVEELIRRTCHEVDQFEKFVHLLQEGRVDPTPEFGAVIAEALAEVNKWRARVGSGLTREQRQELVALLAEQCRDPGLFLGVLKSEFCYGHSGEWAEKLSPRENFERLVGVAHYRGWDRLLAFFCIYRLWPDIAVRRRAEHVLSPRERVGIELLNGLPPFDSQTFVRCYEEAVSPAWRLNEPPNPAAGGEKSLVYVAYAVTAAQEASSDSPGPLFRFLNGLASQQPATESVRADLGRVWDSTRKFFGLSGELTGQPSTARGDMYSVVVELQDSVSADPKTPRWTRRAWLYHGRASRPARLDDHLDDDAIETPDTIPAYLDSLRAELGRRGIDHSGILFEVFLSRRSLALNVDQWPLDPLLGNELGYEHPVVLRAVDRNPIYRKKLEDRWASLQGSTCLDVRNVAYKTRGGVAKALYKEFDQNRELQCLVLETHFGSAVNPDLDFPCVCAAIAAGLPVIIWARDERAVQPFIAEVGNWFQKPPLSLPELIHKLRRASPDGDDGYFGRHVSLFFENPGYWLPESHQATGARA